MVFVAEEIVCEKSVLQVKKAKARVVRLEGAVGGLA